MLFEHHDTIIFAGDSVTDMGSANPVGEGLGDNAGSGRSYARLAGSLLEAVYPDLNLRIVNAGISGNTSRDLAARFERDVMSRHPQWVSICIGVNDVWRQFDTPAQTNYAVSPEEYRENMEKMITPARDVARGVFVMTPYYMEPNKADPMRARMDEYGRIAREVAEKHGCIFVDLQAMFDRYLVHRHSSFLAWDRIHPNYTGALLIAREFLSHCGFDYNREI